MQDARDNCTEFQELLSAYYDNELSADEEQEVANHLSGCAECQTMYAEIGEISQSLGKLPAVFLNDDFGDRLEALIGKSGTADCSSMKELLSPYLDEELIAEERASVEKHLASCADCQSDLQGFQTVVKSLAALPKVNLDRDLAEEIVAKIVAQEKEQKLEKTGQVIPFRSRNFWAVGAIACAFGLLFAVAPQLMKSTSDAPATVATNKPTSKTTPEQNKRPEDTASEIAQGNKPNVVPTKIAPSETETGSGTPKEPVQVPQQQVAKIDVDKIQVKPPVIASKPGANTNVRIKPIEDLTTVQESIVAYSEPFEDSNMFEDIGISTDEDGLYAIKL